nr:hypothetical protein FVER53263_08576 [Fusarium verticillioides]
MSDSHDDSDGPESRRKRIRQACLNCRKKKVRCTGEKPICQFCNRLGQPCVYAEDGRSLRRTTNLAVQPALGDVPEAIMVCFFGRSDINAASYSRKVRAIMSYTVTQVNCSDDASSYAAKAWETMELPWTGNAPPEKILTVIQTIILIVSTEVPAGLCTQAHMKQGFAIRLAQNNKFHLEPDPSLPLAEREERKRTFWSLYLQDKLISLSRGRFSAIRDEECKISLPCSEDAFKEGREEKTPFLDELTGDCVEQEAIDGCCSLGLINVMASILGRVSHYVLHDTQTSHTGLPWSSTAPYATLSSALLQAEHYFGMNEDPTESLKQRCTVDGVVDQLHASSFIFAKAMFHLSHCLLHHPFLIQQRLQSGKQKAPSVFMKTAWEKCRTHAKSITDLLDMKSQNVPILTSIYGYCIMVAGTIHALSLNDERDHIRKESQKHYRAAMESLQDLSCYWNHAALMVKRLERFHSQCETRGQELSPSNVERTPGDVKALWQSVDYTSLSTPTRPGSPTLAGQTSVEADWALSTDMFDFSGFGGFAEGVDVFSISFVDGDMTLGDEIPNMVQNWAAPEKAD